MIFFLFRCLFLFLTQPSSFLSLWEEEYAEVRLVGIIIGGGTVCLAGIRWLDLINVNLQRSSNATYLTSPSVW